MSDDANKMNEALFNAFNKEVPGGAYVENNFLEPLANNDGSSVGVFADWLADNGHPDLGDRVRDAVSLPNVRRHFMRLMLEEMANDCMASLREDVFRRSRLEEARRSTRYDILTMPEFVGFMDRRAGRAVASHLRMKMREHGFMRRIMPPTPITDDELDRSVPTNLPLDPTKDNPYQAFRRARDLADTFESWARFMTEEPDQARKMLRGVYGPAGITVMDEVMEMPDPEAVWNILSTKGLGLAGITYVGTPKDGENPFEAAWKRATEFDGPVKVLDKD